LVCGGEARSAVVSQWEQDTAEVYHFGGMSMLRLGMDLKSASTSAPLSFVHQTNDVSESTRPYWITIS